MPSLQEIEKVEQNIFPLTYENSIQEIKLYVVLLKKIVGMMNEF